MNKIDTTDFSKEREAKSWTESNIKLAEIDNNLDAGNLAVNEKVENVKVDIRLVQLPSTTVPQAEEANATKSNNDRSNSKSILVQELPAPKTSDKLRSYAIEEKVKKGKDDKSSFKGTSVRKFPAIQKTDPKKVSSKNQPQKSASSEKPLAVNEEGFGYLTIILGNANEYGYGYVIVDGKLWQQGGHNTTPLKIKLPVGNHKVEVQRDGFVCSPGEITIIIEKDVAKQVTFALIPKKN